MKRAHDADPEAPNKKTVKLPKANFRSSTQKHSRLFTHNDVRGILMSCTQGRESIAVHEVISVLTHAKEALKDEFPELLTLQAVSTSAALDEGKETHHQQEYYTKMKEEEGDAGVSPVIKTEESKKGSFQVYDSGCRGLVFVGIRHEIDPVPFVRRAMQLMSADEGQPKLKWPRETVIERIVPVQRTCAATIPKLLETIKPMVEEHLSEQKEPITWGIITHHRNNKEINRKTVIDTVAALVPAKHPVNLSNPNITIIVEIIKSTACITLTPDFHALTKYNPSVHLQHKADPATEKKPEAASE